MLCIHHHSTLLIIAHYTAYRIDYPQALRYEKSTRATGITPRNHNTNTAMFGDLLRSLSACFIPHMPALFRPCFTLFTVIFAVRRPLPSTELQPRFSAVTAFMRRAFHLLIRFFIRSSFTLLKSHRFFLMTKHTRYATNPRNDTRNIPRNTKSLTMHTTAR